MDISNIANGGLVEQTNIEIEKVLKNIMDINTDIKAKRKITIVLEFCTEDDNRDISEITFSVKSQLAPQKKVTTIVVFDQNKKGDLIVEEMKPNSVKAQMWIDDNAEIFEPKVTNSKLVNIK